MAKSAKENFNLAIKKAVEAASVISDNAAKAQAFASIAQALAPLVVADVEMNADVAATEAKPKKHSDKLKKQPKPIAPPKAEAEEEEIPEVKEEPAPKKEASPKADKPAAEKKAPAKKAPAEKEQKWTDEWTDEAVEHFDAELSYLADFEKEYGEDGKAALDELLDIFSSGTLHDSDTDVNPRNIIAFVEFVKEQMDATDEEASTAEA